MSENIQRNDRPIIVGVDIRDLKKAKTGIKTYLEELQREFTHMNDDGISFRFIDTLLPVYSGPKKIWKWVEHFRYQLWKQIVLPLKAWGQKCDIVFCVDNCVPIVHLGYKTVHGLHDAFCFESPESYGKLWLWLYKATTVPGARRSPLLVTATEYGKKQIAHHVGIDPSKIVVVPDGPKRMNYNADDISGNHVLDRFPIKKHNYILHVGSMFKRKNIPTLVKAFVELKKTGYPDLKLVLAGSFITNQYDNDHDVIKELIEQNALQEQIITTGYLTDQEIGQLYANALLYVFPSFNEGFGLPVLEAFEYNVPVIVSNNTCLPEVGGDAVLTFNPYKVEELVAKIQSVLDDPQLRKDMIAKGIERLKNFSWKRTANEIVEVFKRVG
ncbi:glycosyltransferase family 4 protein [Mucilaginibacter ginkgonis]|uniref:Glycosyltransferase family 4 protein n=1 Tax=Mucilaginibacter ginkgonis TaxID=2682091 RepID=A0A6I4I230_9SPHI|nr:glycosyltransferase family 1 protein [Mucilaginibacter ginkgonis]QQL50873.1 glycosyltransferase family 4 protein [Mucilaginibacter ginkgonis]